jgi:hypothetical protein
MIPPLKVWRNILIFVLLAGTYILFRFQGQNSPYNQTTAYYQEKIKQFHQTGKDTISVVVLGSSLAINAFGTIPHETIPCKPVKILNLTVLGLNMDGIQAFGLLKTLADFPPNYLLFESNLLASFSDSPDPSKFITGFNTWFFRKNPMAFIRNDRPFVDHAIEMLLHQPSAAYFTKQKDITQTKFRSQRQYQITDQDKVVIDGPFRKLIQKHCKIILVNYPVMESPSYQKIQSEFDKKIIEYQEKYGTPSWKMPENHVHDQLFIDGAHMNESGSQIFVPWFSDRLNEEICTN